MRNVITILIIAGVAIFGFHVSCVSVDEQPQSSEYCYECEPISFLKACNCEKWITYVDEITNYLITFYRLKGQDVDRDVAYRYMSSHADMHKAVYILGLKDAFDTAYTRFQDKQLSLPYKVNQYYVGIDSFCKNPENKNKKVAEVFLIVNEELKKARQ